LNSCLLYVLPSLLVSRSDSFSCRFQSSVCCELFGLGPCLYSLDLIEVSLLHWYLSRREQIVVSFASISPFPEVVWDFYSSLILAGMDALVLFICEVVFIWYRKSRFPVSWIFSSPSASHYFKRFSFLD